MASRAGTCGALKKMNDNCDPYRVCVCQQETYRFRAINDRAALIAMRRRYGKNIYFHITNLRTKTSIVNETADAMNMHAAICGEILTTPEQSAREQLLDYNESLCKQYNETDDPTILELIAATEILLINNFESSEAANA